MTTPSAELALNEDLMSAFALLPEPMRRPQTRAAAMLRDTEDRLVLAERLIAEQERRIRQLEDLADSDALTSLLNRRGFQKFFDNEAARMSRYKTEGSYLLLIDLDLFKEINDKYGHQAGDACLAAVAKLLTGSTRVVDGVARFGGDEFAVLLTQTNADRAAERIQTLSNLLNNLTVEWKGQLLRIGASIGGAPVKDSAAYDVAYREADARLYLDKNSKKKVK